MSEISELTTQLSKDFNAQLQRFIATGENVKFETVPKRDGLNKINKALEPYGVRVWYLPLSGSKMALQFEVLPGTEGYFKLLCRRASSNFDTYLNRFLTDNQSTGLPINRLSERMWTDLNIELLKRYGIILNRETYTNGKEYMMFRRKQDVYNMGTQTIRQKLFERIKRAYPNIPDININAIIEESDESMIYHLLRFKLDGVYDRPTPSEYAPVNKYFIADKTRDNVEYKENGALYGFYNGPDRIHGRHSKYHISLNVTVNIDILARLENIVRQDRAKKIKQYKFFDSYDDIVKRFDPITIYMYDRDAALEQRIYDAIKPYVRSNEGLIGEEIGPGMVVALETTSSLGKSVGQKAASDIAQMIAETPGLTH